MLHIIHFHFMLLLQQGQKREGLEPSEKAQIFRNSGVLDRK